MQHNCAAGSRLNGAKWRGSVMQLEGPCTKLTKPQQRLQLRAEMTFAATSCAQQPVAGRTDHRLAPLEICHPPIMPTGRSLHSCCAHQPCSTADRCRKLCVGGPAVAAATGCMLLLSCPCYDRSPAVLCCTATTWAVCAADRLTASAAQPSQAAQLLGAAQCCSVVVMLVAACSVVACCCLFKLLWAAQQQACCQDKQVTKGSNVPSSATCKD